MRIQPRRRAAGGLLAGKGVWRGWRREIPDTSQPGMLSYPGLRLLFELAVLSLAEYRRSVSGSHVLVDVSSRAVVGSCL